MNIFLFLLSFSLFTTVSALGSNYALLVFLLATISIIRSLPLLITKTTDILIMYSKCMLYSGNMDILMTTYVHFQLNFYSIRSFSWLAKISNAPISIHNLVHLSIHSQTAIPSLLTISMRMSPSICLKRSSLVSFLCSSTPSL